MTSAAIQHVKRNTTSALFSLAGDTAVVHVTVAPGTERLVVRWPVECVVRPARGGRGWTTQPFVVFVFDDAISIESAVGFRGGAVFGLCHDR